MSNLRAIALTLDIQDIWADRLYSEFNTYTTTDVLIHIRDICPYINSVRLHIFHGSSQQSKSEHPLDEADMLPRLIREEKRFFHILRSFKKLRHLDVISFSNGSYQRSANWDEIAPLCGNMHDLQKVSRILLTLIQNTCFAKAFRVQFKEVIDSSALVVAALRWVVDLWVDEKVEDDVCEDIYPDILSKSNWAFYDDVRQDD